MSKERFASSEHRRARVCGVTATEASEREGGRETVALGVVACALAAAYAVGGFAPRTPLTPDAPAGATRWLGVDQWGTAGPVWTLVFLALAATAGLLVLRRFDACRRWAETSGRALDSRAVRLALAAAAGVLFWTLSTRLINADGQVLARKFQSDASVKEIGSRLLHDEMLEFELHYRLWNFAHDRFGWSVETVYRLASCLAGAAAAYVVLGVARRFAPSRRPLLVAGVFLGAWIQLFFGDVENYTVANALVVAYFAASLRSLADDGPAWPAFALFGAAVVFHDEALVFGPSLLVVGWTALDRGRDRDLAAGVALSVSIVVGVVWWFDSHGLPIGDLFRRCHLLGDGGHWDRCLLRLEGETLWLQAQLLLLLAPSVVLVPALFAAGRIAHGRRTTFLVLAALGALAMHFAWYPALGTYDDWNLYAVVAQPIGLLVWTCVAEGPLGRVRAAWFAAFVVLAASHAGTWIVGNHFYSRTP
jgi:hypothetical protein